MQSVLVHCLFESCHAQSLPQALLTALAAAEARSASRGFWCSSTAKECIMMYDKLLSACSWQTISEHVQPTCSLTDLAGPLSWVVEQLLLSCTSPVSRVRVATRSFAASF